MSSSSPAPSRGIFRATVLENRPLCREHSLLRIHFPFFPPTRPGNFLQVLCRNPDLDLSDHELAWPEGSFPTPTLPDTLTRTPLLRRPFSIASRHDQPDSSTILELIQRVVGPGTSYLDSLRPSDPLDILGPLGNAFPTPDPDQSVLLIGGGVGIPPMIYLAQSLSRPKVIAFCGAQTKDLLSLTITSDAPPPKSPTSVDPLYNLGEFSRYGVPAVISTDDGTYGYKGYITQALETYLGTYFPDTWSLGSRRPILFTCGPEIMMKRVAEIALQRGLPCHAAVDRPMACGMGTCQSCIIKLKTPDNSPSPFRYALACTEGPIFNTTSLLW